MIVRVAVPEHHVGPATLEPALEATTRVNQHMIAAGELPLLDDVLDAGAVRWQPEPPGYESFDHGGIVLQRRNGDCDDLASWHAAGLRQTGEDPGARAVVVRTGPTLWHAVVERSDRSIDDPSEWAGMPSASLYTPPTHAPMVNGRCYVGVWQNGPRWRARLDVPVGVAGCCDDKPAKCCACSVTVDHDDPRMAIAHAASGAMVLGGHAGAASFDLGKLQALAALSRGISERQLIDHVDPDLLLCAVLLNQTLERKLQRLAPQVMRRPIKADSGLELAPGSYTISKPPSLQGRARQRSPWRVNRPSDDAATLWGVSREEALDVARGFQEGMARWWKGPDGQAVMQARELVAKYKLARLGITENKIVALARANKITIPEAARGLYWAANFQRGAARFWASIPKAWWKQSPPPLRAAIQAAAKAEKISVPQIVAKLASIVPAELLPGGGGRTQPWTPAEFMQWAASKQLTLVDAVRSELGDMDQALLGFPSPKEVEAAKHAMDIALQKLVVSLDTSPAEAAAIQYPLALGVPEFTAHPSTYWARAIDLAQLRQMEPELDAVEVWSNYTLPSFLQAVYAAFLAQAAGVRLRAQGKKTSTRYEYYAGVATDAARAADEAWVIWQQHVLDEKGELAGLDAFRDIFTKVVSAAATAGLSKLF